MKTFKKLFYLLNYRERITLVKLIFLMLVVALLDMIGVASIMPFMAVLTNPGLIETNLILNSMFKISNIFGVENNQQFLFALGFVVLALLIISLFFKAITTYLQLRFVNMREYSISKRLVEGYLRQPYSWFLNRNSADLGKTVLSELRTIIGSGLRPMMDIIAKGTVTIAIIILLFLTNPKLTLIVGLSIGSAYLFIFYFLRNYLSRIGKERLKKNELRFIALSEAFGAAKEVKVGGLEKIYLERFSDPAKFYAHHQATSQIIAQLPRFILEVVAFSIVIIAILYLMVQTGNFNNALPVISLYVFAGYRLLPALQQMYACFTQLTFVGPSLDKLYNDLKSLKPNKRDQNQKNFSLNKKISLNNIYYNYPNSSRASLTDINLTIPANSTVGLVGPTGSGKTTTVDIILGLLEAQKGTLEVDGKIITHQNSISWQKIIGYVPQHIYLSDDSVLSNIAFGVNPSEIDHESVKKVSKIANLHKFVMDELPSQYQTIIGERGVRLSGGQRQRIGIARALYHNPKVIIFDEATSALDNETEKAVMEAVNNLDKDITIILIAHRLNTLKNCDIIFKLENGHLVNQGSFDKLINDK